MVVQKRLRKRRMEIMIWTGAFLVRALYALTIQLYAGAHGFISYSDAQ